MATWDREAVGDAADYLRLKWVFIIIYWHISAYLLLISYELLEYQWNIPGLLIQMW